jgi:5'-3' exonuclease
MSIKFNELKKPNPKYLMLVDSLNLAFRYKHANKPDFAVEYMRTVQSLAQSYNCGNVFILGDEGHSAYRRYIYPEYKMNRKEKYEAQTEEEKQAFAEFFEDFNDTLELLKNSFPILKFKNVEADDLAAFIVKQKAKYNIEKIWLISSDKDWDILIEEGVSRFSYVTRKEITHENWWDYYPVSIDDYVGLKAIMGDSGDNIKGVEGIGPKRATELLNKYGTIFDLLDSIPVPGKQKFIQKLNESKDLIQLNLQLVDILSYCEDAIGIGNIEEIHNVLRDKFIR